MLFVVVVVVVVIFFFFALKLCIDILYSFGVCLKYIYRPTELVPHGRGVDVKRPCVYSTTLVKKSCFIHSPCMSVSLLVGLLV